MTRQLNDQEIEWLEDMPMGESHAVEGGTNLAACIDCDWTAQADTFDYLQEQVTDHLESTYEPLDDEAHRARCQAFKDTFGWDPWEVGVLSEDTTHTHTYDFLEVTEVEDGQVVVQEFYSREVGEEDSHDSEGPYPPMG